MSSFAPKRLGQSISMTSAAVALALGSAFCFGVALLLTQFGLRGLSPF